MLVLGGSPGLVVMGGDSCSEGHEFESQHRILDGHDIFSHIFVVKIVMFVWKDNNKWKRGRGLPIIIKRIVSIRGSKVNMSCEVTDLIY